MTETIYSPRQTLNDLEYVKEMCITLQNSRECSFLFVCLF